MQGNVLKEELGSQIQEPSKTKILTEETMAPNWLIARNRPVSRNIFYHITSDDF